jgi:ABC-type transport system involved in multi-copper enzyme maturation permease subunit
MRKELLSNILTFRFLVGFVLCLLLPPLSTYVLVKDYEARLRSYSEAVSRHEKELRNIKVYSQLKVNVDRPPEVLSIFCEGYDKQFGNTVPVSFEEVPTIPAKFGEENPLLTTFSSLDIALIVQVVFSLLALLFSYDAITGEREKGTIRLIFSNSISRSYVLLGKYISGMLVLASLLIIGLFFGLVVAQLSPSVALKSSDCIRIGLIFLSSLIYVSTLFTLGMLISTLTSRSSTSLIMLLSIWVFFVVLFPHAGAYLARSIHPVGESRMIETQAEALREELAGKVQDYAHKNPKPESLIGFGFYIRGPFIDRIHYSSKEQILWWLGSVRFSNPLRLKYADSIWDIQRSYYDGLEAQAALAEGISSLSPAWVYYSLTSTLAGTDLKSSMEFMEKTRLYRSQLIDYMHSKKAFTSLVFFTRKGLEQFLPYEDMKRLLDKGGHEALKPFVGEGWDGVEPLDLSDMPRFHFRKDISSSLGKAIPQIMILFLLNVAFFMGAQLAFVRKNLSF